VTVTASDDLLPRLPVADPGLRQRHLLALPDGIGPDEVEVLAASRFRAVRWEDAEPEPAPTRGIVGPVTAALGIRAVGSTPVRALRVARLSTLTGPYRVTAQEAVALGLPPTTRVAYDVRCPRERGRPPYPGGDRDGLKRAFPDGMPVREEERVLQWLVAAARRLGGSVRIGEREIVLTPDVEASVDLTVLADRWVEPPDALAVVRTVAPQAHPPVGAPWAGPLPGSGREALGWGAEPGGAGLRAALERHGVDDERERRRLGAEAAAFDELMLAAPPPELAYGVLVDLGLDGTVSVEVAEETELPLLLREVPWAAEGVVAYRVHWEPVDVEELEAERCSVEHRVARRRVAPLVQAITRALHARLGGEVVDEADFFIDPADL